jgi:hypothetical protein
VRQILLTAEMYGYTAISNSAKLMNNLLKNRSEYTETDLVAELIDSLKIFYSEIRLVLEN